MAQSETTGLRLLVLDGGDIRCLSQLSILEEFLHRVQWKRKNDETILPCDYFHMICATGPAGMIAIFLVVFRMSIEEAKDEFVRIWNAVFADDSFNLEERSSKLEVVIEELLRRHNMPLDRKLLHSGDNETCKGFVCAISPAAPTACQKFRTYRSLQRHVDISIVEAIRATCATPDRFTSVKVKSSSRKAEHTLSNSGLLSSSHDVQEFVTGDNILQNPSREAIKELHEIYGPERKVACVLSLGCGRPSTLNVGTFKGHGPGGSWMTDMLQAERVAEELDAQLGRSQVYYRFSVDRGLESPESISSSSLGTIETHTRVYLQQINKSRDMQNCVKASEVCGYVSTADLYCAPTRAIAATHGLPPLCASFVMRQEVMDSMARRMFDSDESSQKIMILSGMGGSGKTQLVSKFARTYLSRFQHVIFIDARTTESIKNGIISRVKSLGGVCTTLEEALDFLAQMDPDSGPWFLILDNADDPNLELGPVIPNCEHGFVAITTRNPMVGDLSPQGHIKLDIMSKEEALQVLLRTMYNSMDQASDDDRIDGLVVIKELGFLPVAIVQAGSYIKHQGRGRIKDYLIKLKAHRQKLLSIPAKSQLDRHHHAVYATLDVTMDVLSTQARDFLGILACFNYTGFPLSLVDRAASCGFLYEPFNLFDRPPEFQETVQFLMEIFSPADLKDLDVLAELEQFSLVTRVENYSITTLRFHPLTHAWMFDRITVRDERKYRDAGMRLLVCATSEEDEDLFEYLHPQLALVSITWDETYWNDLAAIARLDSWAGSEAAIEHWKAIHSEAVEVYGTEHPHSITSRLQLALTIDVTSSEIFQMKRERILQEVVDIRTQVLPPYHVDTLEAICYLSEAKAIDQARSMSEEDLFRQLSVVKYLEQHPEHRFRLLKSMEVLAVVYQNRKQWAQGESILLKIIRERERVQGVNHLTTLGAKQRLASFYSERESHNPSANREGSNVSAEEFQKQLLIHQIKLQGPYHTHTLNAQQRLAEMYERAGQYNLAEVTMKSLAEGYKVAKGPHSQQILKGAWSLAVLYEKLKRYEEAVVQWITVIGWYKATGDNKQAREIIKLLANLLEKVGRNDDAVARWEQCIREWKAESDNQQAARAMESLVGLLERMGRYDDAVTRWEQWLVEWKAEGNIQQAVQAIGSLAELLKKMGRLDDAVARWEKWIAEWKAEGNSWQVIQAMESLANLLAKMGRLDDAVARWEKWIAEWKAEGNIQQVVRAMESLAVLLEKMGRLDDAVARWEKWIAEWKAEGNNRQAIQAMGSLAELLEKMGRLDDAVARWEKWIAEWKAEGNIQQVVRAMESLAELLKKMGWADDAVARWEQWIAEWKAEGNYRQAIRAVESLEELLERMRWLDKEEWIAEWEAEGNHRQAIQAMGSLAELLEKMGRLDDAVARWEQWIAEWKAEGDNRRGIRAMESLAELLEKMGRLDDAVARWEQCIAEWKAEGNNRQPVQAMESLAELLKKMGWADDAVARWEQWIAEWRAEGDNRRGIRAMESLAELLEKMRWLDKEEWIAEWKAEGNRWQVIQAMESLADLLAKVGRYDDAVARWEQWIVEWEAKGNNRQAVQAMESLADLLKKMGRYDDAKAWWARSSRKWMGES